MCGVGVDAAERDRGAGGHPGSGIDQGIGHEGRPVIGFTFCVQADDVGRQRQPVWPSLKRRVQQQARDLSTTTSLSYRTAIVVPLDEFDIPMPD